MGWDTLVFETERRPSSLAILHAEFIDGKGQAHYRFRQVRVTNTGADNANDVRIVGFTARNTRATEALRIVSA